MNCCFLLAFALPEESAAVVDGRQGAGPIRDPMRIGYGGVLERRADREAGPRLPKRGEGGRESRISTLLTRKGAGEHATHSYDATRSGHT